MIVYTFVAFVQVGHKGQSSYTASKAGVIALSKTMAKELAQHGIRVNVVLPGV